MTTDIRKAAEPPLRPCPFCGGEPYSCRHLSYSNWGVACQCGATGPTKNAGYRPLREAEIRAHNEAVEAWNQRAGLAAEQPQPEAQPVAWREHVEQRIRSWRQRTMNRYGDRLAIDDYMSADAIDDLVDYVCDEYAAPPPSAPCPHIRSSGEGEWATNWCALNGPPAPAAQPAPAASERSVYGILDPDYARIFTIARCIAWSEGYALAMHGSFTRDLDLIAVPWAEHACEAARLAERIADGCGLTLNGHPPGEKPHGRQAFTLLLPDFSDPRFVDLSVMSPSGAGEKR